MNNSSRFIYNSSGGGKLQTSLYAKHMLADATSPLVMDFVSTRFKYPGYSNTAIKCILVLQQTV